MDKTKETIAAYNSCADDFAAKFMDLKLYKDNINQFIDLVPSGAKILDLGCGPGNIARLVMERQQGFQVVGLDLSAEMVALASRNVPGACFHVGDIRDLAQFEKDYDAVIASFSIVHLADDEAVGLIKAASRLVKAGGLFYLSCIQGTAAGYETTSFSPAKAMYYNRFSEAFILGALADHDFGLIHSSAQGYPEQDGTLSTELFFHARKKESIFHENK